MKAFSLLAACVAIPFLVFGLSTILFPPPEPKPYSLVVLDRQGEYVHAFLAADGRWRLRTDPEQIPRRLKQIVLQKEDRWFYAHPGVNPLSAVRAAIQNFRTGKVVSGASTITMQLARMLEPKERTIVNKLVEMVRAYQFEWKYSKDELLELYLSTVPLGGNIEGLQSAALLYHRTPLDRLNIAQLIDLTLIPNDPNGLQPDRNGDRLYGLRNALGREWVRTGFLTSTDSIVLQQTPAGVERRTPVQRAPHFALRLKESSHGKGEILSTLDLRAQLTVEAFLSQHLRQWKSRGVQNGAVLVVGNRDRDVVAYAGSEDFAASETDGQVDNIRSPRSPGSTLKPFLYALEMEKGDLTPKTRLLDTPYDVEGFQAENYDGTYSGYVYADEALQRSLNVPMVRLLKHRGASEFLDFLGTLGFTSLQSQRDRLGLSLILGGCGVTLEELVTAYSTFPSGGSLRGLRMDSRVQTEAVRVFSPSSAYLVTEILMGLERPDLPANFESSLHLPAVAFKTGTSYGRRDAWAIGYSADYTVGVWIGNSDGRGNPELVGGRLAAPLLVDILNAVSTAREKNILPMPDDVGVRGVCAISGLTPTPRCERQITDLFAERRTNVRNCDVCQEVLLSLDGSESFCSSCVGNRKYRMATRRFYPPEVVNYREAIGLPAEAVPQHYAGCERVFPGNGPAILSPTDDMTYYIVSAQQKMAFVASSGSEVRSHHWYLNERFLGSHPSGEKVFVTVREGVHTVTCVDDHGRSSNIRMTVKNAS